MSAASVLAAAIFAFLFLVAPVSFAAGSVEIYAYSQKASDETAQAGGSIRYANSSGGRGGSEVSYRSTLTSSEGGSVGSGASSSGSSEAPTRAPETQCVAAQEASVSPCYGVVPVPAATRAPPGGVVRPPVNPAVLAAAVADRLSLTPGRINASPSAQVNGLTGVASWFWLSPSPSTRSLSVALRGERVTVSASATGVRWSFGDGDSLSGGPGVPYRPGSVPAASVRHDYQTRCLPGDQGRDPYVLASCGAGGYTVTATIEWGISFSASGPVAAGGSLPSRTTSTTLSYPVSEARAFLTSGGSG
jgi:hypothetical protein